MIDPTNVAAPAAPAAPPAPAAAPAAPGAAAALVEPTEPQTAPPAPAPIQLPGKDATAAEWKTYYAAIGAPDAAGLALKVPEGGDQAFATEAATAMAEVGLLPHQAQKLAEWWNTKSAAARAAFDAESAKVANDAAAAAAARVNTDDAALKNEWQTNYEANLEIGRRAVRQFLPKDKAAEAIDALERSIGYGATMRLMHKLGKGLGEGELRGDGKPGTGEAKSLQDRLYPPITRA